MTTPLAVITMPRNCYRCGNRFRSHSKERVCESCRKPKSDAEKIVGRELTFRERQVTGLVRLGRLNKEIAYELHLTEGTVKEYLNRIFRKVEVKNRTELAVWALVHQIAA